MKLRNLMNPAYIYEHREHIMPFIKSRARKVTRPVLDLPHTLAAHGLPVTANDRRLAALKDKHKGQRCFVIGNGPSLRISDLDRLQGEITFASNKIYLAFDQTDWRPMYYTVEDRLVAVNNADRINSLKGMTKIFPADLRHLLHPDRDTIYVNLVYEYEGFPRFSFNALHCVYWGSTVTYFNIELAFYMGIEEVYLIGVDFSFTVPDTVEGSEITSQGERNWFHPNYRQPGERYYLPRLDRQAKAFEVAQTACEANGRAVYNASRRSELEVFPRVDFDTLFPEAGTDEAG